MVGYSAIAATTTLEIQRYANIANGVGALLHFTVGVVVLQPAFSASFI